MSKRVIQKLFIVGLLLCLRGSATAKGFSRYGVILTRRPFAAKIPEPVPAPVQETEEPPAFVLSLRLVALTESPAGPQAGILDESVRPPRVYYLYEGEQEDGLSLLDTDYDREKALVAKDGQQYWIKMGQTGQAESRETPAEEAVVRAAAPAAERAGAAAGNADTVGSRDSYAARRSKRLEEMRRRAEASRNLSEAEVEQQLRAYQMRLIREGKTPLPIPITEEMDEQLVSEGILPPRE